MTRLAQTEGLTEDQLDILAAVHEFVENEIIPVATALEHADEYPQAIVDGLKELGVFGLMIPEEFGGSGFTYVELERYLDDGPQAVSPALAMKIERLIRSSEHKRALPPMPDND